MSYFSEKFRTAVEECGVPVADLAEQSGLSVSMLYKLQSGARLIENMESLERLLDAMVCSMPQRKDLLQAYKIERIGVNRYACFRELNGLVSDIGRLSPSIRELTAPECLNLPNVIFGAKNVNAAIETLINREALRDGGQISLMVPLNHSYSLECISQALCGCVSGFQSVCQLFCLKASGTDDALIHNMQAIRAVFPRMLNLDRYDIRYGYVQEPDEMVTPFPYFIITSEGVLLMNESISDAVFIQNAEICNQYKRSFEYMASNYKPVLRTGNGNVSEFFKAYQRIVGNMKKQPAPTTLAAQPCILPCLTPSIADKYLPPEFSKNPELQLELENFFRNSQNSGYTTFFTMEGLHFLMETGSIMEMIGPNIPRLQQEDILFALEEMVRRAKEGNVIPYLFKAEVFREISRISFGLYGTTLLVGCEIPARNGIFTDITEATLARVIKEYSENALVLGDVFSPMETVRILEEEILSFQKKQSN